MKPNQAELLGALGGGVRPFDAVDPSPPQPPHDFDALLRGAASGDVRTELGIRFAPSVSGVFARADQALIARGVDRAAASGVELALILHDEQTLRVDVRNRIVLEASPVSGSGVVRGIDGFVSTASPASSNEDGENGPRSVLPAPARVVRNASLLTALSGKVPEGRSGHN